MLLALACILPLTAKQTMTMLSGEELEVAIVTLGETEITYKKASNPGGPNYTVSRDKVFFIVYDDGSREVITAPDAASAVAPDSNYTGSSLSAIARGSAEQMIAADTVPVKKHFPRISFYPRASVGYQETSTEIEDTSINFDWGGFAWAVDLNILIPTGNDSAWSIGVGWTGLGGDVKRKNGKKDAGKSSLTGMYFTLPVSYWYACGDWFMLGLTQRLDILVSQQMEGKKVKDVLNGFRSPTTVHGIVTIGNFDAGVEVLFNWTSAFKGESYTWSPTLGINFTLGYRF